MRALHEYINNCRSRRFRYGRHDCALFAAAWVRRHTGRDLTGGIRYDSLRQGLRALERAGYQDHVAVAASHLPDIPVAMARAGDIAVVPSEDERATGAALGIVTGELIAVLARDGIGFVPLTAASRAFRVEGAA